MLLKGMNGKQKMHAPICPIIHRPLCCVVDPQQPLRWTRQKAGESAELALLSFGIVLMDEVGRGEARWRFARCRISMCACV